MTTVSDHSEEIKAAAEKLFAAKPDWTTFYRDILSMRGIVRRYYPDIAAMAKFEQTDTYRQIQRMLSELRRQPPPRKELPKLEAIEVQMLEVMDNAPAEEMPKTNTKTVDEPTKVITVRIPRSLHDALRIEAYERRTSINKLCISKLLQFVDDEHVPSTFDGKQSIALEEEKLEADL